MTKPDGKTPKRFKLMKVDFSKMIKVFCHTYHLPLYVIISFELLDSNWRRRV